MKTKHTPGVWYISSPSTGFVRVLGTDDPIASVYPVPEKYEDYDTGCPKQAEMEANTRLIAAAPFMLEALLHAQRNMPHPDQMIDDAIAKATGAS